MKVARQPDGPDQAAVRPAFPGKKEQQLPAVPVPKPGPGLYLAVGCPQLAQEYAEVAAG